MKHIMTQSGIRWRPRLLRHALLGVCLLIAFCSITVPDAQAASYATVSVRQGGREVLGGQSYLIDGVTYVPFRAFCELHGAGEIGWDAATRTAYAKTKDGVLIYAHADSALYIQYGERYFYTATPVRIVNDRVYIPIRPLARCFGVSVTWNAVDRSVTLGAAGASPRADVGVYASDELYWLARIIQAEAGGEPLKGKIAVGNVVLNRARSSDFPNTVYGVIFDREYGVQFTPTANGSIYCEPSLESVIAARLCLEGYSLSNEILYFFNPSIASSFWIAQNRPYAFRIGKHVFYR